MAEYKITTTNPGYELVLATFLVCVFCFLLGALVLPGFPLVRFVERCFSNRSEQSAQSQQDSRDTLREYEENHSFYLQQGHKNHDEQLLRSRSKKLRSNKRYGGISSKSLMKKVKVEKMNEVNDASQRKQSQKKSRKRDRKQVHLKHVEYSRVGRYEEKLDFQELFLMNNSNSTISTATSDIRRESIASGSNGTYPTNVVDSSPFVDSDGSEVLITSEMKKMWDLVFP